MAKPIRDKTTGKFAGSIGDGKNQTPTHLTLLPLPNTAPEGLTPLPRTATLDKLHQRLIQQHQDRGAAAGQGPIGPTFAIARANEEAAKAGTIFLTRLLGLEDGTLTPTEDLVGYENRTRLHLPSGKTIDLQNRLVNPDRYPLHYIEIANLTFNPRSNDGAAVLAHSLGIDLQKLTQLPIRSLKNPTALKQPLGNPQFLSPTFAVTLGSDATLYTEGSGKHVFIYTREEMKALVRKIVQTGNVRRGPGTLNTEVLSVLIALPKWRFEKDKRGLWRYEGDGTAGIEVHNLREFLR